MVDFLPPVVAKLIADVGEFTAAMGGAEAKLTGFAAAQQRMAGAGKVAMLALGVAAVGVAYESIKMASNFDQAMELIHTQAGAAQSEVDGLKNKVLELAPTVGIGPEKLAEGLYHIESTGFRGKEALDILKAAAKDAAMGLADLDTVTFALSGTMSVGMKDIKDAADATAYLNTIVGMGDMKMDKLAAAIGTGVLPSFKSAGLGMKDFGAALATISDNSVGADEAATRLRMTVSLMAAPSKKAQEALKSIGLGSMQLAEDMRKPDGLLVAVDDLKTHLEKSGKTASQQNAIISQAFGGGRSSSAILTLIEESDRLSSKYTQLGTSASRAKQADEAWAQQQKQFSQQMKEVGAEFQVIGVRIGEFLIPYVQKSAAWMMKHAEAMKIAAVVIGGVLVAAMMAFTVTLIANAAAAMANPVTWIILAIVAAVALLAVGIYELVKHWSTVWGFIKRISLVVWHFLVDQWNAITHAFMAGVHFIKNNIIDPVVHFFKTYFVDPIAAYLKIWWSLFQFAVAFVSQVLLGLRNIFLNTFHPIAEIIMWVWHNVTEPFFSWIMKWAIIPLASLIRWFGSEWMMVWHGSMEVLHWAQGEARKVFDWINHNAIHPLVEAAQWLQGEWNKVWKAISDAIGTAYRAGIKPIIDAIMSGLHAIRDAWNSIMNSPQSAGKSAAKFLGFDQGGWVPGAPGEPRLAIVHGQEFVLSRDMIARGATGAGGPALSSRGIDGGSSGGLEPIQVNVHIDGERVATALIEPAQRRKRRTGSTGLA